MRIGLIDIDGKMPNLALMKLSQHYKQMDDEIELTSPLFAKQYDKILASKIFTHTPMPVLPFGSSIGGPGHSLKSRLFEYIEHTMPDYSLYPKINYSLGFTTRGCIRNCSFCIVPEKEGAIRTNADIYEFWDRRYKKIVLLDNNILALPDHFFKIASQIKKEDLIVDFNQGLDHRLLTNRICKKLTEIRHIEYRFSFDHINYENSVLRAIEILRKNGINRSFWYVLVGFDSTIKEDLYRLNLLKELRQNAYVQRYNYCQDQIYVPLAKWANQQRVFRGMTFEQYLNHPEGQKYKRLFQ